jgi:putative endonuclease
MASHNELGKYGEQLAENFLLENGYVVLEKNWVYQKAEIDIIAQKEAVLAVIEVKTRSSLDFGLPQDFVNNKKIQLLAKAINEYVISNDLDVEIRFDIIAIYKSQETYSIQHITDAFYHF